MSLNESILEDATLNWFRESDDAVGHRLKLAPDDPASAWDSFGEVVLVGRVREAIRRLNPAISSAPSLSCATRRCPSCCAGS